MHSPEPWTTESSHHICGDEYVKMLDGQRQEVFEAGNPNYEDGSYAVALDEDIERIVACVNFCKGVTTKALTSGDYAVCARAGGAIGICLPKDGNA